MLGLINKAGYAFLATVDGNRAQVRGMETYRADNKGILMYTGKMKDVFKQITVNPNVELCYYVDGVQLRITGCLEIVDDLDLKKELVEARPFLAPMIKSGYDPLVLLRLAKGKATRWSMDTIAEPKTYIDF